MLWLVWRQHRWQILTVAALTVAYCGYVVWVVRAAPAAVADCLAPLPSGTACDAFNSTFSAWQSAVFFGYDLPLMVGVFWGAPLLAREVEQGTARLVFTQSVSRRRWLATKLGVLAAIAALLGLAVGGTITWSGARFGTMAHPAFGDDALFGQSGLVPAANLVFALVAGAALGGLLRRLMPAIGATVLALVLAFAGLLALRPHLMPPVREVVGAERMLYDPRPEADEHGWIYGLSYLDGKDRELSSATAGELCADPDNTYPTPTCASRLGLRQRIVYQPADRYIWFQLTEAGVLLVTAAGLAALLRRRIADAV